MLKIVSTAALHPRDSFQFWQNTVFERIVPVELRKLGHKPFEGTLETADLGSLRITRIGQTAIRTEATATTIRRHDKHETVTIAIVLSGTLACSQNGREAVQRPGEFVVLDRRPTIMQTTGYSQSLLIEVPRAALERALGPVSVYAGLTVDVGQASTLLTTNFLTDLIRTHDLLSPNMAEQMSSIGIDLLTASIAERLTCAPPKHLAGTLLVQRANAYIEANLGDPTLDPTQLALAMGISLRRLQQLFRAHDRNVADWIWQRRLELAARRIADATFLHLPLGVISYGCGFIDQAHFSRRFKSRYGLTPSEYREKAVHDLRLAMQTTR